MNIFANLFQSPLQRRLTGYLIVLVATPILLVSFLLLQQWTETIRLDITESSSRYVSGLANEVNGYLQTVEEDVRFLAGLHVVEEYAQALVNNEPVVGARRQHVIRDFSALSDTRGIYYKVRFLDTSGNELIRIDQVNGRAISVDDLQNKANRDYFTNTVVLQPGEIYISDLDLNREGTPPTIEVRPDGTPIPVIRFGTPVFVGNELAGMIVTSVLAEPLLDLLVPQAADAQTYLINEQGFYLRNTANVTREFGFEPGIERLGRFPNARLQNSSFAPGEIQSILAADTSVSGFETQNDLRTDFVRIAPPGVANDYFWVIISTRDQAVLFNPVQNATTTTLVGIGALVVLTVLLTALLTTQITNPLLQLSQRAQSLATGDMSQHADTSLTRRRDEIGELGRTFNQMADQLRTLFGSMEDTINERTRDLQAVADVNAQISTILETSRLLQDVADLTKERFRLYHAHIYQMNDEGDTLVLAAGAGHVGRQMVSEKRRIALNNKDSIVATAARNREGVIIQDVRQSRTFLPHPLLPHTQSELAVPLVARGRVLGVLDVQSDTVNFFNNDTLGVIELLAGQVATALSNATLYEVAARTSRHEAALSSIDAKIQSAINIDDVLQTAVRELGKALRVPHTAIEIQSVDQIRNGHQPSEDSNA